MCEFCGRSGVCVVCGWDQGDTPLKGWTENVGEWREVGETITVSRASVTSRALPADEVRRRSVESLRSYMDDLVDAQAELDGDDDLPFGEEDDESSCAGVFRGRDLSPEDLLRLDGSLGLDAAQAAESAVREFGESIEIDLRYAVRQLRRADHGLDCVRRALDALERVEAVITAATCDVPGPV